MSLVLLIVDEALYSDGDVRAVDHLSLLRLVALRGHGMLTLPGPNPARRPSVPDPVELWKSQRLEGSVRQEAATLLEAARRVPISAVDRGSEKVFVSNRWDDAHVGCILKLDEALRLLCEPLYVLVENGLRDAEFLRRVMPPEWRANLEKWEREGRLRFEHAGGNSEMEMIVDAMCSGESGRTWGLPASAWRLIHFLVFDHDGDAASTPGQGARNLAKCCEKHGLASRTHMLERRRQEYYLPRQAMRWVADRQITDPDGRAALITSIEAFFHDKAGREFGPLPAPPGIRPDFWKHRFWEHLGEREWREEWFADDGSAPELTRLAEALARAM